jgi:NADPH:quinone reductase-like Zn-dependent oxidoreductase
VKAIAINEFGGRDQLQLMDLPVPSPGDGEIGVQVKAAGVNPVDWKIREGLLRGAFPHQFPIIRRHNHDYVRGLGAAHVIDYRQGDFREAVRALYPQGVDVALDTIGGDVLARSTDVVRQGGRLVSVINPPPRELVEPRGIQGHFVFVSPNASELQEMTRLFDAGRLRPLPTQVLPLQDAARAHEMSESRHVRGKIVLAISEM